MKLTKYALAIALVVIALVAAPAYADTVVFNASGTFADGTSLSGTVTIDTTSGSVTALSLNLSPDVSGLVIQPLLEMTDFSGFFNVEAGTGGGAQASVILVFPTSSLVGYSGGPLCGLTPNNCPISTVPFSDSTLILPFANGTAGLDSGSLTPESPVPEPASVMLLGIGLGGMLGAVRRKLMP